MDAVLSRLRIQDRIDFFDRNKVRIAGFISGGVGTLVIGILFTVIYTGEGYGTKPDPVPQVYTNF